MTHSQAFGLKHCLIRLVIVISLVTSASCGSRQTAPAGPPVDKDLARTNRAARSAFENGRIQQAADLYRQTLERAYLRDDLAAAIDAKYNLALCLTRLQSDREALELVEQAGEELTRAGQQIAPDIILLEATIRYRMGQSQEAWQLTEGILKEPDNILSAVQKSTRYLRGLIANDRGDPAVLRTEITALGKPESPVVRADREELIGHLALMERKWNEAMLAFDEAAALRRQMLDYRGMVKVLAKAGEASERAGRLVPASRRYLRAGQSAALQGNLEQARKWLTRAALLAEQGGDDNIAGEARLQLAQLQKEEPVSPAGNDSAGNSSR
jgi:tetratricopeptide (TPR) repeat protein